MYSAASPSAPSLLYRIQPQGKPALSACAWHRSVLRLGWRWWRPGLVVNRLLRSGLLCVTDLLSGGTALVLAAGAELRLVVWSKEDKDLSEGPDGESTWLPDREEQHEGGGLAAHRVCRWACLSVDEAVHCQRGSVMCDWMGRGLVECVGCWACRRRRAAAASWWGTRLPCACRSSSSRAGGWAAAPRLC